jgi:hypothetical protein
VAIVRKDELVGSEFALFFLSFHPVHRQHNDDDEENDIEKGQALQDQLGLVSVKDDENVFVLEFGDEFFGIGNGGDIGEAGVGAFFDGAMTDDYPIAGKGHAGNIMVTEAIAKLAVITFGQAVFYGPDEITTTGEDGEQKKEEEVASENGHCVKSPGCECLLAYAGIILAN